jgi:hypothetical protein
MGPLMRGIEAPSLRETFSIAHDDQDTRFAACDLGNSQLIDNRLLDFYLWHNSRHLHPLVESCKRCRDENSARLFTAPTPSISRALSTQFRVSIHVYLDVLPCTLLLAERYS